MAYKNLNMKFSDDDWAVLKMVSELYDLDQTKVVRFALRNVLKTRPTFEIEPQRGKFNAPAAEVALSHTMK